MAKLGDWANAAGGIPLGLIEGYNYGQKAQREEEKALADIEAARLRNELLGTTVREYMGPGQTEQRATASELQTLLNRLGITTGGYDLEVAQQQESAIKEGLAARAQAAAASQRLLAERAKLGLDLFKGEEQIARALGAQDVSLLGETLKIREAAQKEKSAEIASSLRRLNELALQSGAVDTIRAAQVANPTGSAFEVMFSAYQTAPDNQKAVIAALIQIQNQKDLAAVITPGALDEWLQRPFQPFRGRAVVNADGTISIARETGRVNEKGEKTYSAPLVVRDMEEAKNLLGMSVPAGTRQPTTKAAPVTGAALAGAAIGGTAAPAATTPAPAARGGPVQMPARAPASAGPMGPPAPAPAAPAAAPAAAAASAPARPTVSEIQLMLTDAARGGARGQQYLAQLIQQTGGDLSVFGFSAADRLRIQPLIDAAVRRTQTQQPAR